MMQAHTEWQHGHAILKAYSVGFIDALDLIRAEIKQEYKNEFEHPYGHRLRRAIEIIDKYKTENEV